MAKEVEMKFLVDVSHPVVQELRSKRGVAISQGYLKSDATGVVRVRILDRQGFLTIKGPSQGISRDEFEYEIPFGDARMMLDTMCQDVLHKTRYYHILPEGLTVELDVFSQIDLVIAEIEFPDGIVPFNKPNWLLDYVSVDSRYYNNNILAAIAAGNVVAFPRRT